MGTWILIITDKGEFVTLLHLLLQSGKIRQSIGPSVSYSVSVYFK